MQEEFYTGPAELTLGDTVLDVHVEVNCQQSETDVLPKYTSMEGQILTWVGTLTVTTEEISIRDLWHEMSLRIDQPSLCRMQYATQFPKPGETKKTWTIALMGVGPVPWHTQTEDAQTPIEIAPNLS